MMLRVWFFKETMYKEIVLVRSFTLQGLIGNAGKFILRPHYFTKLYKVEQRRCLANYLLLLFLFTGGYVGLFVGYTVAQAPEILQTFISRTKKMFFG